MSESNRIETRPINPAIVVTAPADRRKTGIPIHIQRRIAVAHFKVDARYSLVSGPLEEIVEQLPAHALPVMIREYGNEQKLGLIGNRAEQ